MSVDHYENFPVASVLCPPRIRPAVVAIYHFARTADDLADEGDASPEERVATLNQYRNDLLALHEGRATSPRWTSVFENLAKVKTQFKLPFQPLDDLLDAFLQDTGNPRYQDRADLLNYCRRSANPVGRLLMHLYDIEDEVSLQRSDSICSALQLINFWQDLSIDLPRGRVYLPAVDGRNFGVDLQQPEQMIDTASSRLLVLELCSWAEELMLSGAPLALQVPGRAGWELRLVVQGGLRILGKIRAMQGSTIQQRPTLNGLDAPGVLWRAVRMKPGKPARDKEVPA